MLARVLVIGANGVVGRQVAVRLAAEGVDVHAAGRHGPVPVDLEDPRTLEAALDGVDGVFLVWPLFDAAHAEAAVTAIAAHARRVVYVSSTTVRDDLERQLHPYSAFHAEIERLLAASGADWTVLRATWLAKNALGWRDELHEGVVRFAYPDARRTPLDERDLAAVAVRALLDDGHAGLRHVVTGPETVTEGEQVALLAELLGLDVRHELITPEEELADLLALGLSHEVAAAGVAHRRLLVDEPEPVTTAVLDVTGAPARTFRAWVRDNAAAFA